MELAEKTEQYPIEMKIGTVDIPLNGVAYFGIQSAFLKPHSMAHFVNQCLDIELIRTFDFDSFNNNEIISFPSFTCISEQEQCSYYLIGKNSKNVLFSNYPEVDFWFLMQSANEVNDKRLHEIRKRLHNELSLIEQVFAVHEVDLKKLKIFDDFKVDFLEYCAKLLHERKQENFC